MADEKDQYTDDKAESDFAEGFAQPNKTTEPAVIKAEDEDNSEGGDGENVSPEGNNGEGEGKTTDGGDGETGAGDPPDGAAEEVVQLKKNDYDRLMSIAEKVDGFDGKFSKIFGTQGDLQQLVKQMQANTSKGAKVEIPADAFKEMEEEFPELAAHFRKALEKAVVGVKGTSTDAPADDTGDKTPNGQQPPDVDSLVENAMLRREMNVLEAEYPDWRNIVGAVGEDGKFDADNPFRVWLGKQPAAYQKRINDTDSPLEVTRAIERFKADAAKTPSQPKQTPNKQGASRKERIEGAVQPKGDNNPPPPKKTADDEFAEGFRTG